MIDAHNHVRDGSDVDEVQIGSPTRRRSNELAADILDGLADRLVHGRGSAKRIAAYRHAASAIRLSSLSLDQLWNRGDGHALTQIEGVTPAVAQILSELITSKRIPIAPG
ncbi:MAG TPA: helix-hairpin-helix domain-containing protein [Gemmatimonadaceae bacterium]|nr:helix-hairpin-helix domain-containing protein [Gemmatimonadaceae bacterium]